MQTMEPHLYVGSFGVTLDFVCRDYNYELVDLSTAEHVYLVIRKPDGFEVEREAQVVTNTENEPPTHEIVRYVTIAEDFDVVGNYIIQAKIEFSDKLWFSETQQIKIYDIMDKEYK